MMKRIKSNYRIALATCLLTALSFQSIFAQSNASPKLNLDSRRYQAWTIEHEPYRLLVENALDEYIALTETDLEPVMPGDIIIAIRSKTARNELFQLRYGQSAQGFTIIEGEEIKWILGRTLLLTIFEKDKYYHLDSSIPFSKRAVQPELDYLATELFWTKTDMMISLDRAIYRFGNTGGILYEWGNELAGRPYSEAGYMRLGITTPVFKIGIQIPSLVAMTNGYQISGNENYKLNGGMGGFGAFSYNNLYGELAFMNNTGDMSQDPSLEITGDEFINYVDFYGLIYLNLGVTTTRFLGGAFQMKPGFTFQRIAHRQMIQGQVESRRIGRDGLAFTNDDTFYYGFFLRADYVSKLIDNQFPRFHIMGQISGTTSFITKATVNLTPGFGIPITYIYYLEETDWQTGQSLLVGLSIKLENPLD